MRGVIAGEKEMKSKNARRTAAHGDMIIEKVCCKLTTV